MKKISDSKLQVDCVRSLMCFSKIKWILSVQQVSQQETKRLLTFLLFSIKVLCKPFETNLEPVIQQSSMIWESITSWCKISKWNITCIREVFRNLGLERHKFYLVLLFLEPRNSFIIDHKNSIAKTGSTHTLWGRHL